LQGPGRFSGGPAASGDRDDPVHTPASPPLRSPDSASALAAAGLGRAATDGGAPPPPQLGSVIGMRGRSLKERLDIPGASYLLSGFIGAIIMGILALLAGGVILFVLFPIAFIIAFSFPALMWISWVYSRDTFRPGPARVVLLCLTWGMLSIVPAALLELPLAPRLGLLLTTALVAPLAEEFVKPLILPYIRAEIDSELDGLLYGVTAGMGFAMVENLFYEFLALVGPQGAAGWTATSLMRGLGSIGIHAIGPGLVGWAYARHLRHGSGQVLIVLAYLVGVVVHAAWNGSVTVLGDHPAIYVVMVVMPLCVFWGMHRMLEEAAGKARGQLVDDGLLTPYGEVTPAGVDAGVSGPLSAEAQRREAQRGVSARAAEDDARRRRDAAAAEEWRRRQYWAQRPPQYPAPGYGPYYQAPHPGPGGHGPAYQATPYWNWRGVGGPAYPYQSPYAYGWQQQYPTGWGYAPRPPYPAVAPRPTAPPPAPSLTPTAPTAAAGPQRPRRPEP